MGSTIRSAWSMRNSRGRLLGRRGRWVSTVIAERSSSTKSGADASRNHVTRRTLEARSGSSNPPDLIRP